jgi:photosystem II stability/assembly factor-like uncharacterized protein
LTAAYFTNPTTGWVVGALGTILSTTDGDKSWKQQKSGTTKSLESVYFASSSTGWAVGDGGVILSTVDGGDKWTNYTAAYNIGYVVSLKSVCFTCPVCEPHLFSSASSWHSGAT